MIPRFQKIKGIPSFPIHERDSGIPKDQRDRKAPKDQRDSKVPKREGYFEI